MVHTPIMKFDDENKVTAYFLGGEYHREDGPALIFENGMSLWFKNGKNVTPSIKKWLAERNIDSGTLSDEDKLALIFYMRGL